MQKLTNIRFYGQLGKEIGAEWNLAVKSVSEAIRAINVLSGKKLFKFLFENERKGLKYQILINGREFEPASDFSVDNVDSIRNSELVIGSDNLRSIEIIPVLEGAIIGAILYGTGAIDLNTFTIIIGTVLIVIGIVLEVAYGSGTFLIIAGLGLVAAGVINLLTTPPRFEDFREVKGSAVSYLFNGPQNTTREGGPVPVGYGRLIIGSQTIAASYNITYRDTSVSPLTI